MRNEIIVQKMLGYAKKISSYYEDCTYEDFCADSKLVEACVFNLSQIGELANKADEEYVKNHPEIAWRHLYGLRNRIVHDYEGVNLNLIWQIISEDIPELIETLKRI